MNQKASNMNVRQMTLAALLGALSALLMYFKFPVPLVPPFVEFDFTNVIDIIGALALGPVGTVMVILIKWLVKLLLQGTQTGMVGELSGLLLNLSYALPTAFLYQHRKTKSIAVTGMAIGCVLTSVLAVFSNIYVMFPLYGLSPEAVVQAFGAVNPFVHDTLSMALWSLVPFNLAKTGVSSLIALLLYPQLRSVMKELD